ncbi:uncharacterized protein LOC127841930 [Dreissena polymorpha]|uniref:Uncharacterized protein n=1 Tax=Dreissena polymorpha TaxID=45954 RepID=A0A9D4EVQ7_DREPO|nr:uncharacterized protein LOC127841930 [Dreissena polymorpha]KAH3786614.1 hypothetical protein DPMN_164721 [Dreissena polymorpha]
MHPKDQEIADCKRKIEHCEREARSLLEKEARDFEDIAQSIERETNWNVAKIFAGCIGIVVGTVLSQVSYEASLVLTLAGWAYAGTNLSSAVECMRAAKVARNNAEEKRAEAAKLHSRLTKLLN